MRYFWPWFFGFLIVVAVMIGASRPDLADQALIYLGAYLAAAGWVLLAYASIALGVVLFALYRRQATNIDRPVDGAHPMIRRRLTGGRVAYIDPNRLVSPIVIVDPEAGPVEVAPAAGFDRQIAWAAEVEHTNRIRAAFPGDYARRDRYGSASSGPTGGGRGWLPAPRATSKAQPDLAGSSMPAGVTSAGALAGSGAAPAGARGPTFAEGLARSSARFVAVGVNVEGGDLVRWPLDLSPHARIHGQSQGAGKTNLAKSILLGAAYRGAHLVIADRRRFKDWAGWDRAAELIDANDPAVVVALLDRLVELYRARDLLLAGAGAAGLADLDNPPPRVFVLLAEFGALCQSLDAADLLRPAQAALSLILREAGAAGVHLIFEDQIVDRRWWPRAVVANAGAVFTGRLPLNVGAAGGYYGAHDLAAYTFHFDGALFRSWDMGQAAGPVLDRLPAPALRLLVDGSRGGSPVAFAGGSSGGSSSGSGGAPKWLAFAQAWLAARPDLVAGGTNDLARAMAQAEGLPADQYTRFKGIASRMLGHIRAQDS